MADKIFFILVALIPPYLCFGNWKDDNVRSLHFTSWKNLRPDYMARMSGEEMTQIHVYPFQVGLSIFKGQDSHFCGGSLIFDRWVLTAAHCVDMDPDDVYVTLGAYQSSDVSSMMMMRGTRNVIHENWDPDTHQNDVALINLPHSVIFTEFVQPLELDRGGNDHEEEIAATVGRGTSETQGTSSVLVYVMDVVMPNEECVKAGDTYKKLITPKHMCTSGRGFEGVCRGDSGGPLLQRGVQIGITSFGAVNCSEGMPVVYMRVSAFYDWISEHTLDEDIIQTYLWITAIVLVAIFCFLFMAIVMERNYMILKRYYTKVRQEYV